MTRVAVIGAGHWGKNLIKTFFELGELAAIVEADDKNFKAAKAAYPDIPLYRSYEDVVKSDIPAVAIATPAATHYEIARKALLNQKDVFVEKPLTLSVEEGKGLCELAADKGRILMVGHLLLYQPAIQTMKKMIEQGKIGRLFSLHQSRAKLGRVRSVENVLWSFGVHDIAVLLYLVGMHPERIEASGQRLLQKNIEDDVYVHLSFPNNIQAHLHTSWVWPEQERRLIVVGSQGMLIYEEQQQSVIFHDKGIHPDLTIRNDGSKKCFQGDQQPLKIELSHFLDCISTRRLPLSDGQSGVDVIRIIESANQLMKGEKNDGR